jgi:LPS-assembly lipoprotein
MDMFRGLGAILLAALVAAPVSGCGYRPLFGTAADGLSVSAELQSISIPEPSSRVEQLIRNEILSTIAPVGTHTSSDYVLEMLPQVFEEAAVVAFNTDEIRRTIRVRVSFTLKDARSGKPVYGGKTFSQVSYDRTGTPFANVQARTNAEERAAREVGSDIRTRLAAYFAARQG